MWHRQGKVNLTKGSDVVTGVGTNWVENIRVGDAFQGPDGKLYQVINVASNEALAISPAYEGNTATNLNYWIVPIPGYNKTQADRLSLIISKLDGDVVDATEAATKAKEAATQAQQWKVEAAASAAAAQSSELSAAQSADRAEQARDDAVVVVTDGQGSLTPAPGKFPVAGTSGTIKQDWIENLQFELDALRVARNKLMYGDGPYPVLDLQFQGAKYLDPRVTFTRATPDWDWEGIEYDINEPVLSEEGLWMWGSRTNLIVNNVDMPLSSGGGAIIVNAGGIPHDDGIRQFNKGVMLQATESSANYYYHSMHLSNNKTYTLSFLVRMEDGSEPRVASTANSPSIDFSIVFEGTYPNAGAIKTKQLKDGVWLVSAYRETVEDSVRNYGIIQRPGHSRKRIEVFGFQLVEGDKSTPLIPTNGSQVTVASSNSKTPFIDSKIWTAFFHIDASLTQGKRQAVASIIKDAENSIRILSEETNEVALIATSGTDTFSLRFTQDAGDEHKLGVSYDGSTLRFSYNGQELSQAFAGLDVSGAELQLGSYQNADYLDGYIKNTTVYEHILSNEQLQELTS